MQTVMSLFLVVLVSVMPGCSKSKKSNKRASAPTPASPSKAAPVKGNRVAENDKGTLKAINEIYAQTQKLAEGIEVDLSIDPQEVGSTKVEGPKQKKDWLKCVMGLCQKAPKFYEGLDVNQVSKFSFKHRDHDKIMGELLWTQARMNSVSQWVKTAKKISRRLETLRGYHNSLSANAKRSSPVHRKRFKRIIRMLDYTIRSYQDRINVGKVVAPTKIISLQTVKDNIDATLGSLELKGMQVSETPVNKKGELKYKIEFNMVFDNFLMNADHIGRLNYLCEQIDYATKNFSYHTEEEVVYRKNLNNFKEALILAALGKYYSPLMESLKTLVGYENSWGKVNLDSILAAIVEKKEIVLAPAYFGTSLKYLNPKDSKRYDQYIKGLKDTRGALELIKKRGQKLGIEFLELSLLSHLKKVDEILSEIQKKANQTKRPPARKIKYDFAGVGALTKFVTDIYFGEKIKIDQTILLLTRIANYSVEEKRFIAAVAYLRFYLEIMNSQNMYEQASQIYDDLFIANSELDKFFGGKRIREMNSDLTNARKAIKPHLKNIDKKMEFLNQSHAMKSYKKYPELRDLVNAMIKFKNIK